MIFKKITIILFNTIIFILIFDFFFGKILVNNEERFYRIKNNIYHHTLKAGYETNRAIWGEKFYKIEIDLNGFKYHNNERDLKNFDYAFIGDSFTEGVGFQYSDTFVGKIDDALKNISVANLGVSSYSPKIFLSKLNYFINNGYSFKEVFVAIDSSDILDDYFRYEYVAGIVIDKNSSLKLNSLHTFLNQLTKVFPLTYNLYHKINRINKNIPFKDPFAGDYYTWTKKNLNSPKITNQELYKAIQETKSVMEKLYILLKNNNINLSIIVYPSPFDMKHSNFNSLNRTIWKEFCHSKCNYFIDLYPAIFETVYDEGYEKAYLKYYIAGDNHFNYFGHEIIKNEFFKNFNK